MNTLEYLLEKNKKYILSSKYQNTIYNGKTLCEYFGVESKTKKEGAKLEYLLYELVLYLPEINVNHIIDNLEIYNKYQDLYLLFDNRLVGIKSILKQINAYKEKEIIPLYKKSIMWCSNKVKLYYINLNTKEIKYDIVDRHKKDIKVIDFLPVNKWKKVLESIDYNEYKKLEDTN